MSKHALVGHITFVGLVALIATAACEGPVRVAQLALIADGNRSGVIDPAATDEDAAPAILLANLDDDDSDGKVDSADQKINGTADLDDLSPLLLRAWPEAPDTARVVLSLDSAAAGMAQLFQLRAGADPNVVDSWTYVAFPVTLTGAALRTDTRFAVEGTTLVTSTAAGAFDGHVRIRATLDPESAKSYGVTTPLTDEVVLRVAPVVFQWNTAPTRRIFYTKDQGDTQSLADGIQPVADALGITLEGIDPTKYGGDDDVWMQDFIDFGQMSRPGEHGAVTMRVAIRSAQPDRVAGKIAHGRFFGPDFASVDVHNPDGSGSDSSYSMNSFGNWDVIPPYSRGGTQFPLGRNLWGATGNPKTSPDPVYADFVRAQRVQPEVHIDTSWLLVGHVDEFTSFVQANTARGFLLLVADVPAARAMLRAATDAGQGSARLFVGKTTYTADPNSNALVPADRSIDDTLADADLMAASQVAAAYIDEGRAHLQTEIGLADDEIVSMPGLYENVFGGALAWIPGTVNLLHTNGRLVIPDPFGPIIDGQDLFKTDLNTRLTARGLMPAYADDWDTFHLGEGEVHCGSNVLRDLPTSWWEGGR